jgi:hypothetical protein
MVNFCAIGNSKEQLLNPYKTRDLCPANLCPDLAHFRKLDSKGAFGQPGFTPDIEPLKITLNKTFPKCTLRIGALVSQTELAADEEAELSPFPRQAPFSRPVRPRVVRPVPPAIP